MDLVLDSLKVSVGSPSYHSGCLGRCKFEMSAADFGSFELICRR